ncbi:hypothetical protein JKL49_07400 [Phenylobacterium sp. 20VBR1]|uniref:Uncharacterized protein n=1 Tax=Phenylobacterium glaciei TaxID=2803784 RepID=A0A941CZL5_9CAUL|nr:hypothetical protein [Phenylobacterium glaciei]MBR7619212.1 hypothetical protein [Phenylobacterium glaciei]
MADISIPQTQFERLARWAGAQAGWPAIGLGVGAAAVLVLGALFITPGAYLAAMPHDSLSMVDIGYRLASGQVPGRDFHSAFGVFFQLQMAAAYSLGQTVSQTLEIATLLFFGVVAGIMAYVARSRLSNLSALVVSFAILLLGCAPYAKADHNLAGATFAMLYNREGWALLTAAALFWITPRRAVSPLVEGVLLGLLTAACIYLKLSYGGIAVLFCGVWGLRKPGAWPSIAVAAIVAALAAATLELSYGWGFNLAYLRDVAFIASASGGRIGHILLNVFDARYELAFVAALAPLIMWRRWRDKLDDYIFVLFVAGASLLIVWQNAQVEGLILLWAALVAVIEPELRAPTDLKSSTWKAVAIYVVWSITSLTPSALVLVQYGAGSIALPPLTADIPAAADLRFTTPREDERIRGVGAVYGDEYAEALRDGVALLKSCPQKGEVFTADLFEPFALLTDRPPNHGWTWHDLGHSFTPGVHPSAAAELGGVTCVMIPHRPNKPASTEALIALYGPYIEANFPLAYRSRDWTLRVRPPTESPK